MNKELTLYERYTIFTSLQNKVPIAKIAENLKRHKSTIYREIKRNSDEKKEYSPQKVHNLSVWDYQFANPFGFSTKFFRNIGAFRPRIGFV